MKNNRKRSQETVADVATRTLIDAHNEIISNWFERWADEEKSRIDRAFKKPNLGDDRQVA